MGGGGRGDLKFLANVRAQGCTGLHRTLSRGRNLGVFQSWLMLEDTEERRPRWWEYPGLLLCASRLLQ